MPDISGFHSSIVLVHVVGVVIFVLAHAVTVFVLFRVQSERNPDALRRLLALSRRSLDVALIGFLLWFFGGILAGFSGNWWTSGRYWIWAALAIAITLTIVMTPMGRLYLNRVRTALGVDEKTGAYDPSKEVDSSGVAAAVASGQPIVLAIIGIVGLLAIFWLMLAKPF